MSLETMTIPRKRAIAALRKCVADALLAEDKLETDLRIVRRFRKDAELALKIATAHSKDKMVKFVKRSRK